MKLSVSVLCSCGLRLHLHLIYVPELAVAYVGDAPALVLGVHPVLERVDNGLGLGDRLAQLLREPDGYARGAGVAGDADPRRALEYLAGVEDAVYLLVLQQAVRVDAGLGSVEFRAVEGGVLGDVVADDLFVLVGDVADDGRVHAVHRAAQLGVLDDHGLQRGVARALAYAEQRAVYRRRAVEPCRGGVHNGLAERPVDRY